MDHFQRDEMMAVLEIKYYQAQNDEVRANLFAQWQYYRAQQWKVA